MVVFYALRIFKENGFKVKGSSWEDKVSKNIEAGAYWSLKVQGENSSRNYEKSKMYNLGLTLKSTKIYYLPKVKF